MSEFDCPQCGNETPTLYEGCCEDCREENQAKLNAHNFAYDEWNTITPEQRNLRIKQAIKEWQ